MYSEEYYKKIIKDKKKLKLKQKKILKKNENSDED